MMGDIFKEQLVKKIPSSKDKLTKIFIIVIFTLLSYLLISAFQFAHIIILAVGFLAYYLLSFLKIEYEYIFTNGELDIDIIYNRSRRKRKFSFFLKDIEIMTHIDDENYKNDFNCAKLTIDCSSGIITDDTYVFLYNYNGKKTKFIIEPNEQMKKAFQACLYGRKFVIKE